MKDYMCRYLYPEILSWYAKISSYPFPGEKNIIRECSKKQDKKTSIISE
jgi:hypothetical protein